MSSRYLLDASAVLALIADEPGADRVRPLLHASVITTLNLTEVVKKLRERGVPSVLVDITITELQIPVRAWPSDATQAIQTGELASASRRFGLSLGDCVCLAAAAGWGLTAVTAEHRWTAALPTAQIINIREAPPSPGA